MYITRTEIDQLEHLYKINLINSISGYKAANLIGTKNREGLSNVAVFSSVVHYGSAPPILGFVLRPTTVRRNTYDNIKATGYFTINHIYKQVLEDAHHTSAKYPADISEFDQTSLEEEYLNDFYAPFVKGSPVQIGMKYLEEYEIKANGTILVLGEILDLHIKDALVGQDGFVDLAKGETAVINGLDSYLVPTSPTRFSYQRPKKKYNSKNEDMKVLITGTTGYIAKRLIPKLLREGHELWCCVRDFSRIPEDLVDKAGIEFLKVDFLAIEEVQFPEDIDAAYYLIHSMASSAVDFEQMEQTCAVNFKKLLEPTNCKQVIYLSGIVNDTSLSKHLKSRLGVEHNLASKEYQLTVFRAGIIVGSGSASFEIIRDLVEKLPVMVAPRWLNTRTQPIAIRDVLSYLSQALGNTALYGNSYDIYGPEIMTYKQMLLQFASVRGLKRYILTLPVLTPKLSSYWLYFVTSTSYKLAISLVDSMKVEVIGKPSDLNEHIPITPISYREAVEKAFVKIRQNSIISSWKDALSSGVLATPLSEHIDVPHYGCFKDVRKLPISDEEGTLNKIWKLGGANGWYRFNGLWRIRGYIDKLVGGVGLRRGRRHATEIEAGDALDFWRVLYANKEEKRMLLFAEMKLPGEAWLEFKIVKGNLYQRAVFRPKGVWGRLYWFSVLPFHGFVFSGMIKALATKDR